MFNRLTPAVKNLLIINGIFFVLSSVWHPLQEFGPLRNPLSDEFMYFQFLTHMFLHADIGHIFGNMLGLLFLGPLLESIWGTKRFYIFYFVCGFGASLLYLGVQTWELYEVKSALDAYNLQPNAGDLADFLKRFSPKAFDANFDYLKAFEDAPTNAHYISETKSWVSSIYQSYLNNPVLGASGAIYGIILGAAMLFPNQEVRLYFFIPVKMKWVALGLGAYAIWRGIINDPSDSTAHWAHLGGMLFAFILIKVWNSSRQNFY